MPEIKSLEVKHNLISETRFHFKSSLLIIRRLFQNLFSGTKTFSDNKRLLKYPVISFSESELWNADDNLENWILTAGKLQNLRLAAKKLNGLEVEANRVFSFWQHIGNPNFGKGYVIGREVREGCIIPSVAGGLCQLSNALYDAALKANFEIIERHRHTKVIKGSLAEQDRDATVKWNYIDLKLRSSFPFRIEIEITTDKLIVFFRAHQSESMQNVAGIKRSSSKLNDCYSCGNVSCFKYPGVAHLKHKKPVTTFILDYVTPELKEYIRTVSGPGDFFIVPMRDKNVLNSKSYRWEIEHPNIRTTLYATAKRALFIRMASRFKINIFSLKLKLDKSIAISACALIPIECTHLVISQNLLPFIWQQGMLGGRTFDVLMTGLPIGILHEKLNSAHKIHSECKTLNDFRAPQDLIDLENTALTKARKLISPHTEIQSLFNNKIVKLTWTKPLRNDKKYYQGNNILFPGPAYGRKGAYLVRRLAQEVGLSVVLTTTSAEQKTFWKGVSTKYASADTFHEVRAVIYPAYTEHQPRFLLKALSCGIPVIATVECGIELCENLTLIQAGDYECLKEHTKRLFDIL